MPGEKIEPEGRPGKKLVVILMLLVVVTGTGLRLLVISQTAYLANSSYSSYLKSSLNFVDTDEVVSERSGEWLDSERIFENYFVMKADRPTYSGLFWQLVRSNHPPLYYVLLHSLIGLSPDKTATPAKGFTINMAGFWASALLVYLLGIQLTRDSSLGLFAAFLYSINPLSMEAFVLHKGYELQVTFILLVFFLVFSFQDREKLRKIDYLYYGAACVMAFLVHYYSYIWVAGICLIVLAQYAWITWNPGRLIRMAVATVLAVITAVLAYPPIVHDLLTDHRSLEITEKLGSPDSYFWLKAEAALDQFARYILTFPYYMLGLLTVAAIIMAAILKPGDLCFTRLATRGKWVSLAIYAGVFFWLIFFISPFESLRYVSPVIPLVPLLGAGFLLVLPVSYRSRVMVLAAVIFLSFNLSAMARVYMGDLPSGALISGWRNRSLIETLGDDDPVIVVHRRIREKLNPVFYHSPPRPLAVCNDTIPEDLFRRPGQMLVLLDNRYSRGVKKEMADDLKKRGFRYAGRFGGFFGFLREGKGAASENTHPGQQGNSR